MNNKLAQITEEQTKYSGADWIQKEIMTPYSRTIGHEVEMSPLGRRVADLLGELFGGIYHLDHKALRRVDWSMDLFIKFNLGHHELATTDFNELTRLVFLAHHMSIRVSIEASAHDHLMLLFHPRPRSGFTRRHPTLSEAVKSFEETVSIPAYEDRRP
jgi:hypothetical protein